MRSAPQLLPRRVVKRRVLHDRFVRRAVDRDVDPVSVAAHFDQDPGEPDVRAGGRREAAAGDAAGETAFVEDQRRFGGEAVVRHAEADEAILRARSWQRFSVSLPTKSDSSNFTAQASSASSGFDRASVSMLDEDVLLVEPQPPLGFDAERLQAERLPAS